VIASEQARVKRIQEALNALPSDHETLRIPWRGKQSRLPIIRIGLTSTALNPRSHRIKAQLESHTAASAAIAKDPDSDESQTAIGGLLRSTLGFESLKQNLSDEGQLEPGIITHSGRLINANTRAVALADLGEDYIEVAVLPADATIGEIYDLELDLQVAQDYKQDYSFTNELLFVEDLITDQGRAEKDVAIRLRWAAPTKASSVKVGIARVQRYVRHLDLIRDIQRMSGGKVPITYFDDAEQALMEFDAAYEGMRNKSPRQAEQLKQARILGLLVDLGYERQRQVDAIWVEAYLSEALLEQDELKDLIAPIVASAAATSAEQTTEDSDLAEFEGFDSGYDAQESDMHKIVDVLVRALGKSAREDRVTLPTAEGPKDFDREVIKSALNDAMRAAAEDAKSAAKAGSDLSLPAHLVQDAVKRLQRARTVYDRVGSRDEFDQIFFTDRLDQAQRALDALRLLSQD